MTKTTIMLGDGYCRNCKTVIHIDSATITKSLSEDCPVCGCDTVKWYQTINIDAS